MEESILKIIKEIQKEKNKTYEIKDLPLDIIIDFNKKHFEKFKHILLENALEYINTHKTIYYERLIKDYKNDIEEMLNIDTLFQATTTKYGIINIYNKLSMNIDNYETNTKNNTEEYIFITDLYRNIALAILQTNPNINFEENKQYEILDELLYTKNLDHLLSKECSLLTEESIPAFKYILIRFILSDNFLYFESLIFENELDEIINECMDEYDEFDESSLEDYEQEDIEEYKTEIDEDILNYIYNCIKTNRYILPTDKKLRHKIYDIFITYNMFINSQTYDLTHLEDNDKILELKKINPLCLLEKKY